MYSEQAQAPTVGYSNPPPPQPTRLLGPPFGPAALGVAVLFVITVARYLQKRRDGKPRSRPPPGRTPTRPQRRRNIGERRLRLVSRR